MLMFDKTTNRHRGKKPHVSKQPLRPLLAPSPTDERQRLFQNQAVGGDVGCRSLLMEGRDGT